METGEFLFYTYYVNKSMFQVYSGNKSGPEIIEPKGFLELGTDTLGLCLPANAGDWRWRWHEGSRFVSGWNDVREVQKMGTWMLESKVNKITIALHNDTFVFK